jgi:2-methylaconitate cis-trans-isomerase PrpF
MALAAVRRSQPKWPCCPSHKIPWADVDYFFAQVSVEDKLVDFKPTCGNILTGVGPAAIEMGLVEAQEGETSVNILAQNTQARVACVVQTPARQVSYEGAARIDGVPGSSAPIAVQFMETVGGITGAFLPTGNRVDEIDGIAVTCMDVAMPMVIAKAESFGLTGYETAAELDENRAFFDRMEAVRQKAGALMGMGDVTKSVTPKFGLLAPAKAGGTIATRYFMPWSTHPSMACNRRAMPRVLRFDARGRSQMVWLPNQMRPRPMSFWNMPRARLKLP